MRKLFFIGLVVPMLVSTKTFATDENIFVTIENDNGFNEWRTEIEKFQEQSELSLQDYLNTIPSFQTKQMTFTDISEEDWFKNDVEFGGKMGILKGKNTNETFIPTDNLTRAEVAAVLNRNKPSYKFNYFPKNIPTDLSTKHWGFNSIMLLVERDVLKGYEDKTLRPDQNVTRAEFLSMIDRYLQKNDSVDQTKHKENIDKNKEKKIDFDDMKETDWYYNSIKDMIHLLDLSGYEDGTFKPNNEITRAEMAVIVNKYYDYIYKVAKN